MDHVLQPLRSGSVAAVVDMHPAVGQAVRLHFQHHALQCAVLAAGLAQNLQITGIAGLPDDPDAQHPRHSSHSGLHAAIAGKVCQRFQRKQQMSVLMVRPDLLTYGIKGLAGLDQRRQTLHQQPGLRTSRQAVQHKDPRALVALLVLLARQQCSVIGTGQRTGNGHNVHLVCALVGGEPVRDVGAGGAGAALIGAHHLSQRGGIHLFGVHILLLIGQDLQRHAGKIHIGELVHICRGIYNDLAFHIFLHFQAAQCRGHSFVCDHHSSFSKPCQLFFQILLQSFRCPLTIFSKCSILFYRQKCFCGKQLPFLCTKTTFLLAKSAGA